jgi:hypothetical protein
MRGEGMRKAMAFLAGAMTVLSVVGCTTSAVSLSYAPGAAPKPADRSATAQVSVGDFSDNRREPARWIGAIRGGYGNPLKTLETDKPVNTLVKDAFRQALISRGLYSDHGRFVLSGTIDKLDGDQVVRKEATVQLQVSLMDTQRQREILNRPASSNEVEGSVVTMKTGVFGSIEELRSLIQRVLSEAIDGFVDSRAFLDAIHEPAVVESSRQGLSAGEHAGSNLRDTIHVGMPLIDLAAVAPKPVSSSDKVDTAGKIVGRILTYDDHGRLVVVTVENGVVTSIVLK